VVIDGDVHVLPADAAADLALSVGLGAVVVLRPAAHTPAGAAGDPAELLDVDVDELTGRERS
jgi:hypothetical protein